AAALVLEVAVLQQDNRLLAAAIGAPTRGYESLDRPKLRGRKRPEDSKPVILHVAHRQHGHFLPGVFPFATLVARPCALVEVIQLLPRQTPVALPHTPDPTPNDLLKLAVELPPADRHVVEVHQEGRGGTDLSLVFADGAFAGLAVEVEKFVSLEEKSGAALFG